jgi:hypothetical protein
MVDGAPTPSAVSSFFHRALVVGALVVGALAAVGALCCALCGCGGPLAQGRWLFDAGRYPQAKQVFASLEAESASWDGPRFARYALYRGLTLGALGDRDRAARWLARAKAVRDGQPRSLSRDDALRLDLALAAPP